MGGDGEGVLEGFVDVYDIRVSSWVLRVSLIPAVLGGGEENIVMMNEVV